MFFLLNKICDGGSSKEPFLKAATLSILIWAYPRGTKTNNGNFKMPPFCRVRLLTGDEHTHSFCRCVVNPVTDVTRAYDPTADQKILGSGNEDALKSTTSLENSTEMDGDCEQSSVLLTSNANANL